MRQKRGFLLLYVEIAAIFAVFFAAPTVCSSTA
jgi:hypothetical protein